MRRHRFLIPNWKVAVGERYPGRQTDGTVRQGFRGGVCHDRPTLSGRFTELFPAFTDSLEIRENCYVEQYLADTKPMDHFQFQRIGYFCTDKDSTPDHLIFNRTVSLKDTWSKVKDKA